MAPPRKVAKTNGRDARTPSPSRPNAASSSAASSPERPAGPLSIPVPPKDREVVKVNNANPIDLKHACDDALKRYLARPDLFKQIHLHTDVRLALGWLSVFVAAGTALYGYKVAFEKSKPVVWAGLALYIALTAIQTLYAYFIEGEIVFVGKRKTFSKRIITERITISSTTKPVKKTNPPQYSLSLHYVRSTSGGKSLLAKGKTQGAKEYNAFFDEPGTLDQERFEQWVGELVEKTMEGKTS
ncbi:microsomal signal peptidase 25 kDa subunit-domain-containing protein [Lyophyllum atratum]|nr:microsomal signal peptidase 25 kDa subunit-domain-containing protein [Lyophyllum atratum]